MLDPLWVIGLLCSGTAVIARGALLERRSRVLLARERSALANLARREAELAQANEQLTEHSRRDALTGMGNRWALADDLPKLDAAREADGRSFALALCDVDHSRPTTTCSDISPATRPCGRSPRPSAACYGAATSRTASVGRSC